MNAIHKEELDTTASQSNPQSVIGKLSKSQRQQLIAWLVDEELAYRELSNKVFQGACRLARKGYKLGGNSGFGVRRMLIDQHGRHKTVLQPGERKNPQTDRVILVPRPEEEIRVVHWIYQLFIDERKGQTEIARLLNAKGIRTENGRAWTREKVRIVLTNEKYIGNNVYHQRFGKLRGKWVNNPPEKWIRAEGVFQGIVERERFLEAQKIIKWRGHKFSDEELLASLRALLNQHGRLTSTLIREAVDLLGITYLEQRFGSLISLYKALGYQPRSRVKLQRGLFEKNTALVASLIEQMGKLGATATWDKLTRTLLINNELRVRFLLMRYTATYFGNPRWNIRLSPGVKPDLLIAARMDCRNEAVRDYYLFSGLDPVWRTNSFAEENGVYLDTYRFASLDFFLGLTARIKLPEAA